jgi:membrane protease YdiL (CAAX protease family)
MTEKKSLGQIIKGLSFLLILVGLLIFLYVQSFTPSSIFPNNNLGWNAQLQVRVILFTLSLVAAGIFARKELVKLATVSYWKAQGLFLGSALASGVILLLIKGIIKGAGGVDIISAVAYMSLAVIIVYCYLTAQVEELLFGGVFYPALEKVGGSTFANISTALFFAILHYAASGGNWVIMVTYIPLRLGFNYVRNNGYPGLRSIPKIGMKLFGPSQNTQQSAAGAHFAWNGFVLSFIKPFQ